MASAVNLSADGSAVDERGRLIAPPQSGVGLVHFLRPAVALGESTPRAIGTMANVAPLSTGRLTLVAIALKEGDVVRTATFFSATTALATGTAQWFALFDSNRNRLAVTADDTSTAWAANTAKTLTFATPYQVPVTNLYYLGIMVAATTVPTLTGLSQGGGPVTALPPIQCGSADGSLTNPASCPAQATALTALAMVPYAYVS